jgi:hypothetical protein
MKIIEELTAIHLRETIKHGNNIPLSKLSRPYEEYFQAIQKEKQLSKNQSELNTALHHEIILNQFK